MAAKALKIPVGTPFLPLASARLPPKALAPDVADQKFRALQAIANGPPRQYTRRHDISMKDIVQKFQDLYAEFPPVSKEVVEAHRRLGYPAHYIRALETGEYKIMIEPPKREDGSDDLDAFASYWSFDFLASGNIETRKRWQAGTRVVEDYLAKGTDFVSIPRLDWAALRSATRFFPSDFETIRLHADKALALQVRPLPGTMDALWKEYSQADEDAIADDLVDVYAEKAVEVAASRRLALLRWMESRGDISGHDAFDFLPKTRDFENALLQILPPLWRTNSNEVEPAAAVEIPSWQDVQDAISAQHMEWQSGGVASATEAEDEDTAVEQEVVQKGGKVTAMELLMNKDKVDAQRMASMPSAEHLPAFFRSIVRTTYGDNWQEEWEKMRATQAQKGGLADA